MKREGVLRSDKSPVQVLIGIQQSAAGCEPQVSVTGVQAVGCWQVSSHYLHSLTADSRVKH